jgi:hypothetical protein
MGLSSSVEKLQIIAIVVALTFNWLNFVSLVIVQISILGHLRLTRYLDKSFCFAFFGSMTFYMIYGVTYFLIVCIVSFQFKALNQILPKISKSTSESGTKALIREVRKIHDDLYEVIEAISSYFLINCVTFLLILFFFGIFLAYVVFIFVQNPKLETFFYFLTILHWVLLFFPFFVIITYFSNRFEKDSMDTIKILENEAISRNSIGIFKSLDSFHKQSLHCRPVLSFGLLEIDWFSAFTIMNGIFSFSIILIQFYDVKNV